MSSEKNNVLVFRQLFENDTSTYTYLLGDANTKEAVLIDPVKEKVERDLEIINRLGLTLKYGINTHVHADHVTGTGLLKQKLNFSMKSVLSVDSGAKADVYVKDGELIKFGAFALECRSTPGHTNGCMSYVLHAAKLVFTGDALLIGGCGRTDFQQGNSSTLYDSIHKKVFTLPDDYMVYPAHDYTGQLASTVGEEKKFNKRLTKTREEFINIMANLNLPKPKYIDIAVPNNMICGLQENMITPSNNLTDKNNKNSLNDMKKNDEQIKNDANKNKTEKKTKFCTIL